MPAKRSNPKTMHRAGKPRREQTPIGHKLWAYLRGKKLNGVSFRHQHAHSPYIVDFCSIKARLNIEWDRSQHLEQEEYDLERTVYLKPPGYEVLRFWNTKVTKDINGVIRAINGTLCEQ